MQRVQRQKPKTLPLVVPCESGRYHSRGRRLNQSRSACVCRRGKVSVSGLYLPFMAVARSWRLFPWCGSSGGQFSDPFWGAIAPRQRSTSPLVNAIKKSKTQSVRGSTGTSRSGGTKQQPKRPRAIKGEPPSTLEAQISPLLRSCRSLVEL